MDDLGVLAGSSSHGNAINDVGMITGLSTSVAGPAHAFLYDGVEMHDIGTLGISVSEGRAINATGQIAGFSFPPGSFDQHAIFYDGAIMHDLGTLGGAKSFANGINDAGLVTGVSDIVIDETSVIHAFVWDGAMHDLNDLVVDLPPGVTIELQGSGQLGVVINNGGQIAASGRYLTGGPTGTRAFLLTPVPEPAATTSMAMASAALAAIAVARARRGRRPTACAQPVS
jgi:probable HAF family extracellular repeat protein